MDDIQKSHGEHGEALSRAPLCGLEQERVPQSKQVAGFRVKRSKSVQNRTTMRKRERE